MSSKAEYKIQTYLQTFLWHKKYCVKPIFRFRAVFILIH